jgi:hypothetical protein
MIARTLSPGVKRPGLEVENFLLSNTKVNNGGGMPALTLNFSWHGT